MDQWTTGYFVSHGTRLHYYRTGGSKHPLVLLHGITDDGLCWTPVTQVLANEYDVIMVDVRAHGKSDAPDQGYDYETIATEIAGLISGLELEHPIVMGHSMGAMISLTLAGLYPDQPRAIILEDPPAFWRTHPPSQEDLDGRAMMKTWMLDLKRKTHADLLDDIRSASPSWPEDEISVWVDSKHRLSLKIVQLIDSPDAVPVNFVELLQQIICPAFLITADRELGAILTNEDVAELQSSVHHLESVHISGAGHNIRREQFSTYMEILGVFLGQIKM